MTAILKITAESWLSCVKQAAAELAEGKIAIFPTETCYGIGCNAEDAAAVRKIFAIKKRNPDKPLPIIVADEEMARKYAIIGEKAEKLIRKFMPGPLSIVAEKKQILPDVLSKDKIAFRISGGQIARQLSKELGKAIVASSANLEDQPEIYSAAEVIRQFNNKVAMILDRGELPRREPSTIYDLELGKVLRRGPVSEEEIKKALQGG